MKTTMKTGLAIAFASALVISGARAASVKPYTLTDCVVTGNELGSMGKVVIREYEGHEIKLCCKPCIKKFENDPAKYLSKLPK
ncbi:MAG: hypothetical protein WCO60_16480 [Verrucomicrobiota bacterium]